MTDATKTPDTLADVDPGLLARIKAALGFGAAPVPVVDIPPSAAEVAARAAVPVALTPAERRARILAARRTGNPAVIDATLAELGLVGELPR